MASQFTTFAKKHSLILFFALSFAIAWIIWLPQLAAARGLLAGPVSPYLHLIGGFGPMLAVMIVTGLIAGKAGLRELVGRMFRWRVRISWHLIAWFSPIVLFAVATVIIRLASGTWPDLGQFGQTKEYPQLPLLVYWIANIVYGWGEETGWRGFALPRLQQAHSAMTSTLILSIIWALWHLPLFGFVDDFVKMGVGGAMGWYFSLLLGAVLFTWLYNSTRGSIGLVAVFHGMSNIVFNSPVSGDLANIVGMLMTLWGIAVIMIYKPSTLSRSGKQVLE